eukprot:5294076-Pyramimonas_sp.AAC.1
MAPLGAFGKRANVYPGDAQVQQALVYYLQACSVTMVVLQPIRKGELRCLVQRPYRVKLLWQGTPSYKTTGAASSRGDSPWARACTRWPHGQPWPKA